MNPKPTTPKIEKTEHVAKASPPIAAKKVEPLKEVPTIEVQPKTAPKSLKALQDFDDILAPRQETERKIVPPAPQKPLSSIYDYDQSYPTMEKYSTIPPLVKQEKPKKHHSHSHDFDLQRDIPLSLQPMLKADKGLYEQFEGMTG